MYVLVNSISLCAQETQDQKNKAAVTMLTKNSEPLHRKFGQKKTDQKKGSREG